MQKFPDFVPAFSHHLKPLMRDGSQFTYMLFHPRIDGGISLDSAVESQQFRSHRRSTFCFRDLWLRCTLTFPSANLAMTASFFLSLPTGHDEQAAIARFLSTPESYANSFGSL